MNWAWNKQRKEAHTKFACFKLVAMLDSTGKKKDESRIKRSTLKIPRIGFQSHKTYSLPCQSSSDSLSRHSEAKKRLASHEAK
jgi:hypothetical protein